MAFGDILQDINLHIDGEGFAGRIGELTLPKIAPKVMEYIAGGMGGPIDIPMGTLEKMEAEFTLKGANADVLALLGIRPGLEKPFSVRGVTVDSSGVQKPVKVDMRATVRDIDFGAWKPGEETTTKISVTVNRYEYQRDGQQLILHDVLTRELIINGTDQTADMRAALGL